MKIKNVEIKGKVTLAPMAGITDLPFRELCKKYGAAYVETEMVSAKGIIYNNEKTLKLMEISDFERPCGIQLFASEGKDLEKASYIALKYNPDIIDINMGCPAPKINKSGAGAVLMTQPKKCYELVKAAVLAVNNEIPITVKIRSGVSRDCINAIEIAKYCEDAGASAITVHGRTKEDKYSKKIDLSIIKKVKESVSIPVIGNGDIKSAEDAKNMLEETDCDLVMVGRAAIGNPYIFTKINKSLDYEECKYLSDANKISIMKDHILNLCKYKGEKIGIKQAKKHIYAYLKNFGVKPDVKNTVQYIHSLRNFSLFLNKLIEI